jgi:outer membrane immunogenic protein
MLAMGRSLKGRRLMLRIGVVFPCVIMLGVICGMTASSAADMGEPYTPTFFEPVYDWSGAYVGINLGYGWGRSLDTASLSAGAAPALFTDTASSPMNGLLGGAQIGYNVQMQSWLVGVETDFQGANQRSSHSFTCPAGVCTSTLLFGFIPVAGPALSVTSTQQLDFFGTVRGRAGFVVTPAVLLYATGGFAYGQVDSSSNLAGSTKAQNFVPGWTVGGGIEGAIGSGWSVRLEYLYLDLGNVSGTFASSLAAAGGATTLIGGFTSHVKDNIARAGLNYKFSGPVVTKY